VLKKDESLIQKNEIIKEGNFLMAQSDKLRIFVRSKTLKKRIQFDKKLK